MFSRKNKYGDGLDAEIDAIHYWLNRNPNFQSMEVNTSSTLTALNAGLVKGNTSIAAVKTMLPNPDGMQGVTYVLFFTVGANAWTIANSDGTTLCTLAYAGDVVIVQSDNVSWKIIARFLKTLTSPVLVNPDIDGGTIDNSVIGGSTPKAGTFTTLTSILALNTPSSLVSLEAADTITATNTIMRVAGDGGPVTLTATPTIADGVDGQTVRIMGTSDANHVTLQDNGTLAGSGLIFSVNKAITLYQYDWIEFCYIAADDKWVEIGRSAMDMVGKIVSFGGDISTVPRGYLPDLGTSVLRADFPALFASIGTTWGAADSTHFNVPPPGVFLRGVAHGSSNDPDRATRTASAAGGNTGDAVGSVQADGFKSHTHVQDAHAHMEKLRTQGGAVTAGRLATGTDASAIVDYTNTANTTAVNQNTGGNETRPINIYVEHMIKI